MAPADTQLAATEGDLTVGERRSRSRTSVNKFTRGSHFFSLSSLLTRVRIQEKKRKLYPENKMPPSYKALLQSIDETDVSKGLGRSIKAPRRRKCFCCRRLCLLCTCIILMILIPVLAILGVYLVSPTSLLPFKEWFHWDDIHWFQPIGNLTSNSTNYNHTLNATNDQIDENTTQLTPSEYVQQVIDWTVEKIDDIPKIPLIISLSLSGLVLFTLIWLAVYRRVIRRQRRRHIAKLVTDLQSGDKAFLLNSDESDDD